MYLRAWRPEKAHEFALVMLDRLVARCLPVMLRLRFASSRILLHLILVQISQPRPRRKWRYRRDRLPPVREHRLVQPCRNELIAFFTTSASANQSATAKLLVKESQGESCQSSSKSNRTLTTKAFGFVAICSATVTSASPVARLLVLLLGSPPRPLATRQCSRLSAARHKRPGAVKAGGNGSC